MIYITLNEIFDFYGIHGHNQSTPLISKAKDIKVQIRP